MPDTIRKSYKINKDWIKELDVVVYTFLYEKEKNTSIMLQVLRDHQTTPLKKISWILEKEYKIMNTRPSTLRIMAKKCGIPYKED